jgi:hypothetical protein
MAAVVLLSVGQLWKMAGAKRRCSHQRSQIKKANEDLRERMQENVIHHVG